MSITISHVSYTEIHNPQGKLIFRFVNGTLLDNIVFDLWQIIIKNFNSVFAVGKHNREYVNYRLITKKECETCSFTKLFVDNYTRYNGLLVLDTEICGVLCNDKCSLALNSFWIRLYCEPKVSVGDHILFKMTNGDENAVLQKLKNIRPYDGEPFNVTKNIGLFVTMDAHF